MTDISAAAERIAARFDTAFAAVIAACADFFGQARQGRTCH